MTSSPRPDTGPTSSSWSVILACLTNPDSPRCTATTPCPAHRASTSWVSASNFPGFSMKLLAKPAPSRAVSPPSPPDVHHFSPHPCRVGVYRGNALLLLGWVAGVGRVDPAPLVRCAPERTSAFSHREFLPTRKCRHAGVKASCVCPL